MQLTCCPYKSILSHMNEKAYQSMTKADGFVSYPPFLFNISAATGRNLTMPQAKIRADYRAAVMIDIL